MRERMVDQSSFGDVPETGEHLMSRKNRVAEWALVMSGAFLLVVLSGCATTEPEIDLSIPGKPGVLYQPEPRPGMTVESAKAEMSVLLGVNNRLGRQVWLMRPHNDSAPSDNDFNDFFIIFDGLGVYSDRVEFLKDQQILFVLLYENLIDSDIFVKRESAHPGSEYTITVSGVAVSFHGTSLGAATRFADAVYYLQQEEKAVAGRYGSSAGFETLAEKYRASVAKPPVTEEQRMYVVQANALNQQKDYSGALELYDKAITVDPVSYPEAWFNMALISALQGRYRSAIAHMKRYLLLVPDARDARAAQDKIYEWDILRQKR
jgi:hypothetical protein